MFIVFLFLSGLPPDTFDGQVQNIEAGQAFISVYLLSELILNFIKQWDFSVHACLRLVVAAGGSLPYQHRGGPATVTGNLKVRLFA